MRKILFGCTLLATIAILVTMSACAGAKGTSADQTSSPVPSGSLITSPPATGTINKVVDAAFAYKLIQANNGSRYFMILDVRTPEEFASDHIDQALNIDSASANLASRIAQMDTLKIYLVYCRTGVRSAEVVKLMADSGFKTLFDLDGGITAWTTAGYPVVK
jgi:rhodanese-related sulfurtransferase